MTTIASSPKTGVSIDAADAEVGDLVDDFKPLSAEEARAWRQNNSQASPWRVLLLQLAVGALMALLVGLITGQVHLAASSAWGTVSVVIPAMVFARALTRQMRRKQMHSTLLGLIVWELVKVVLTVALLLVAPKVIANLSWFTLVAGFVVTMKVYWLAMALGWMQRKSKPSIF